MKKYLLLTIGFEMPTPEIMEGWNKWFDSLADVLVDQGGFSKAKEIDKDGITRDLPLDLEAVTGYVIVEAEDLAEAEKIAGQCPSITSIRVYEIRDTGH